MTYLSGRKRNQKKYLYYSVVVILFCFIVYFWPAFRVKVYSYAEGPLISYFSSKTAISNTVSNIHAYFSSRNTLLEKNLALSLTIERLENELAEKNSMIKEEDLIKSSGSSVPLSTLVLYPVAQDLTRIYSTVILSKGFKDGVIEHSIIYVRGRQAVCTVTEVYDRTALCTLYSSSGQKVEGTVSSSTTLYLEGAGGGSFVAEVPRDTNITEGDTVYLKSNQTFTLGTVTSILRDNQMSSWYVYVKGAYNPVSSNVFYMNQ